TMTKKDRSRIGVLSDATWVATAEAPRAFAQLDFQAQDWSAAHSFGKLGIAPWGELPRGKGGAAGTATAAESLKLPPGFKAELLYSVPRSMQGSWVSLAVDPKNRFYVSDQGGRMYRVTVGATADDTEVDPLALAIGGAQGLLWAHDSLYVMVNGGPKSGMWRLRDTDGDDQLDDMKQLLK